MAWDSDKTQIVSALTVTGTTEQDDDPLVTFSPAPYEECYLEVKAVFPGTATDNLVAVIHRSITNTTPQWDDILVQEIEIPGTISATDYFITKIQDPGYEFKVSFKKDADVAAGDITVDAWVRGNGGL
jgi:hypothetical protein